MHHNSNEFVNQTHDSKANGDFNKNLFHNYAQET